MSLIGGYLNLIVDYTKNMNRLFEYKSFVSRRPSGAGRRDMSFMTRRARASNTTATYPLLTIFSKISKFTVPTLNDIFTNKTLKGTLRKHSTNLRSS